MKLNVEDYYRMFKAKQISTNNWIFGMIDALEIGNTILYTIVKSYKMMSREMVFIQFETICRNTFVQDINNRDIFSNDIIETHSGKLRTIFEVRGGFGIECLDRDVGEYGKTYVPYDSVGDEQTRSYLKDCKVVGNIFDNYNLIESFKKKVHNV